MRAERIDKSVVVGAPRARVWRALSNAKEFGAWFGARFDGDFRLGATARGTAEGMAIELSIEELEPETAFAFRWSPFDGILTNVRFRLTTVPDGTLVQLTESGFERVPLQERAGVMHRNSSGWARQMRLIEAYCDTQLKL